MILIVLIVTNYYLNKHFFFIYQTNEEKTFFQNISYLKSYYFKVKKLNITMV